MYYVYILRCEDNSLYTGISTDLQRRMEEHFQKTQKCAKYTLKHTAKKLEATWTTENRANASKLEYYLKTLKKIQKEKLLQDSKIEDFLAMKLDCTEYQRISQEVLQKYDICYRNLN